MISFTALGLMASASAALVAEIQPTGSLTGVDFAHDQFMVDVEMVNLDSTPTTFLPWKTPLDDIWEDVFVVRNQATGEEVEYTGKIARRMPVTDSDYMTMQSGEIRKARVDLTRSYDIQADGVYSVSLRQLNQTDAPEILATNTLSLNMMSTHMQEEAWMRNLDNSAAEGGNRRLMQSFGQCTSAQRNNINSGRSLAINTQVPRANACMTGSSPSCGNTWTNWFGAFQTTRYNTVRTCWQNIRRDLPNANFQCCVGCGSGCGPNLFAYVFPTDPNMIQYICQAFFNLPDERAETLTHEQSHFRVTCGTTDWTYGESSSLSLARTNPQRAIENADNHCFFGRWVSR